MFGFGVVGQGLYEVLQKSPTLDTGISKICVKNRKQRSLPENMFCYNPNDILDDPSINTIVELIYDSNEAYQIVKRALQKGKNVVSFCKKMLKD